MSTREPVVGEVWTIKPTAQTSSSRTRTIQQIHGGRVTYLTQLGELFSSSIVDLNRYFDPPKEPWQEPLETERWFWVDPTGTLGTNARWTQPIDSLRNHEAFVKCKVTPMLDTLVEVHHDG